MTTRRTFLVVGLAGGAALTAAWWLRGRPGQDAWPEAFAPLASLDAEAPAIVAAIARALLDGALPPTPQQQAPGVATTVGSVARAVSGLPPAAQKELGELFALLGLAPTRIALARVTAPWAEASVASVGAFLDRWRASDWQLQRAAYDAMHQLVFAAWYGNPGAWPAIGYPGPPTGVLA